MNIKYIKENEHYLFPDKNFFISTHDDEEFICGKYEKKKEKNNFKKGKLTLNIQSSVNDQ